MTHAERIDPDIGILADEASQHADSAARRAGVEVRELDRQEHLDAAYELYRAIWRPGQDNPPVTPELLRAFVKSGNYVAGAFDGGQLVGSCVGFFGSPTEGAVHSHIAGVAAGARGRSVGFALKVHQRAWALSRGEIAITWTFDPLVRRNAYFNIVKLAATPVEYLPRFYGAMHDGINGGDEADRVLVRWDLPSAAVAAVCGGERRTPDNAATLRSRGAWDLLGRTDSGGPHPGAMGAATTVLAAVPGDVESLRATDPRQAREWRLALREALTSQLSQGARITGFLRDGRYVLEHPPSVGQPESEGTS